MAIHQTHTSPPKLLELTFPDAGIGNKVVLVMKLRFDDDVDDDVEAT